MENLVYKDTKLDINVKAISPEVFITGATYYSYDVESGRFLIHLKKEQVDFSIPEGTDLKMTLVKLSDNTKYIVVPEIEDRLKGIISLVIPKILLGYVGGVRAGIFIKPPNTQSVHGGYFTFSMALSDIDDDNEEMVEFYNQLFEDMAVNFEKDVNGLMANAEEHADGKITEYDKKFEEVETKVSSMENQATLMEKKQDEILEKIEKNDVPTKLESSTNVVYQIIGKENFEMAFTMDFKEKVKGSVNENPNTLFGLGTTTLPRPSEMTTEVVQERYTAISEMDGNTVNSTITDNAYFPKFGAKWNLVEHVKKVLGEEYFLTLGAATLAQQVALLRTKITSLSGNSYGYGHSPSGYKISMGSWLRTTNTWESVVSHASDTISKLTIDIDKPLISNYIDDNGFFYTLVYSDPSDGKTATKVVTDYTNVVFTMEISANEHIKSMIAANQVESIATGEEAEEGKTDEKLMTPLKTKEFYLSETKVRRQKWDEGLNWIAHRGNNSTYPENSLLAFQSVTRHWGIETDIQVTSDGHWVVMHDNTVDRTTNGTGTVASKTLEEFRSLRIDSGPNVNNIPDSDKIPPTLEEYLLICKKLNKVPVIEIKSGSYSNANYKLLSDSLNLFGFDETNCVIGSFDYTVLVKIREIYPNMELHYFVGSISASVINNLKSIDIPAVCSVSFSHASVDNDNIKLLHASGFKVGVWTPSDESFISLINKGIDYITTDSKSGNLRYSELVLDNGFLHHSSGGNLMTPFIEETSMGLVKVTFTVTGGINTKETRILLLPDWATPQYTSWHKCNVRTANGTALATVDILGALSEEPGVVTGLGWDVRTSWANGNFTYNLY